MADGETEVLREVEGRWRDDVFRVLGMSAAAAVEDPALARLRAAYAKLAPQADSAAEAAPSRAGALADAREAVETGLAAGDAAAAKDAIMGLGALVRSLAGRAEETARLEELRTGPLAVAAIDWRSAAATLADQVTSVAEAMAVEIDEPDVAAEAAKLGTLADGIGQRGAALGDALDALASEGDLSRRGALAARARAAAAELRAYITANPLLAHVVAHPLDGGDAPDPEGLLLAPLDRLDSALRDAAQAV